MGTFESDPVRIVFRGVHPEYFGSRSENARTPGNNVNIRHFLASLRIDRRHNLHRSGV